MHNFDPRPERKSIGDIEPNLIVFHRTVGEIHRTLTEPGFVVERLLEPGSDDPRRMGRFVSLSEIG